MTVTHGGRSRNFDWTVQDGEILIQSESGMHHRYALGEILTIIRELRATFGGSWIPLANNVEKMYSGTERPGLGMAIFRLQPGDTVHAQGASYLGVVLEKIGIFEWNGQKKGIAWRLRNDLDDIESLESLLREFHSAKQ